MLDGIRFEWDSLKAESNRRKHGVSFETGHWGDEGDPIGGKKVWCCLAVSVTLKPARVGERNRQRPLGQDTKCAEHPAQQ